MPILFLLPVWSADIKFNIFFTAIESNYASKQWVKTCACRKGECIALFSWIRMDDQLDWIFMQHFSIVRILLTNITYALTVALFVGCMKFPFEHYSNSRGRFSIVTRMVSFADCVFLALVDFFYFWNIIHFWIPLIAAPLYDMQSIATIHWRNSAKFSSSAQAFIWVCVR